MRELLWKIVAALALAGAAMADDSAPSFGRDVAPLLREKCGACHTPEGVAPFSVLNYADARQRAGKIARITLDGLMPPWLPTRGAFQHQRKLSEEEIALLRRWVEAGAPEGPPVAPVETLPDGWQLGKPDLIYTMPRFYAVPADHGIHTAHFVFPMKHKETRYLRAVEILPGNRRVLLQANVLFDRSGRARELAGTNGFYERFGGAGFFPSGEVEAFVPGRSVFAYDAGTAMTLPAGVDAVLQVRYKAREEQEMDVTRVGLYFTTEPPKRNPSAVFLGNEEFRIAPGAIEELVRDRITLAAPLDVREIRPNLLRFGQAVKAWAELPSGKKVPLLQIDDWNFAWQETYELAQPVQLPKGTVISAEWTLANSSAHELRAGESPGEEAPALWVRGTVGSWSEHLTLTGANLQHYTDLTTAARRRK